MAPNSHLLKPRLKGKQDKKKKALAGYASRRARKPASNADFNDVYEFSTDKRDTKRLRLGIGMDLTKDEALELGQGVDDGISEGEARDTGAQIAKLLEEGDTLPSSDDEDLDSDQAWGSSDEEKFAGYGFKPAKVKKSRKRNPSAIPEVDLNEGNSKDFESEYDSLEDEDDANDFLDVLDVFDEKAVSEEPVERPQSEVKSNQVVTTSHVSIPEVDFNHDSSTSSYEDEDEDEDEEDKAISASESGSEVASTSALTSLIFSLPTSIKRKSPSLHEDDADDKSPRKRKRRLLPERSEAGPENVHAAAGGNNTKLSISDLLAPLQASNLPTASSLSISIQPLLNTSKKSAGPLSAPLELRAQERIDREAAYDVTKEEVDKWESIQRRIKEAKHLSFPLQSTKPGRTSNMELVSRFQPKTELESSVARLLATASLSTPQDINAVEELAMNHLSAEEVARRRGELAKMREIMYRNEVKARRVGKIKSKTFRKIRRKQRERLGEAEEIGDIEEAEALEKHRRERALERATLKHRQTGKWARGMKGKEGLDDDCRRDVNEMLERGELLRKKILGISDHASDQTDEEEADSTEDETKAREKAFNELQQLRLIGKDPEHTSASGVYGMKFMQDAHRKGQEQTNRIIDDAMAELAEDDPNALNTDGAVLKMNTGPEVRRQGGRIAYQPGVQAMVVETQHRTESDASSVTLQSADLRRSPVSPNQQIQSPVELRPVVPLPDTMEHNPWLTINQAPVSIARKANAVIISKDSKDADRIKHKLVKDSKRTDPALTEKDDAKLEISSTDVLQLGASQSDDEGSEVEYQNAEEKKKYQTAKSKRGGVRAFEQRDLVALAFAGDNVVQAFEEAKKREVEADAPKTVDVTIPGWGTWAGQGVKKNEKAPKYTKQLAGVAPAARADAKKAHVIISEKRDKKAAKYMVKDLPFPYTSKRQFERAMDIPVGTEWNTRIGFQNNTMPRVVKKMGTVIEPLQKDIL